MLVLDALIRYSAFALLLMLVVLIMRDARRSKPARYAALLAVSAAALLLGTPHPDLVLPVIPNIVVRFLDVPSIIFAWWFGRSLFEDEFSLGWLEWLVLLIVAIPVALFRLSELEIIEMIPNWLIYMSAFTSILLMLHLMFITLSGRNDDLIESRRRARMNFLIALSLLIVLILIGERVFYADYPLEVNTSRAAIILVLAFWGVLWMLRMEVEKLSFEIKAKAVDEAPHTIDPRDQGLFEALVEQMEVHKVYTEAGLSIRALADKLSTPEHRLRALINQGMGYRNFSAFVNNYRIEAVKVSMQQPENSRIPILTLAMNVGFNSLAPFNRAFSSLSGETPSEYRARLHQ